MTGNLKVQKIITVAATVFLLLLVLSLILNLVKLANASATEKQLNSRLTELNQTIENNEYLIEERESLEYLDRYARDYLNMKGEDEDVFSIKKQD